MVLVRGIWQTWVAMVDVRISADIMNRRRRGEEDKRRRLDFVENREREKVTK